MRGGDLVRWKIEPLERSQRSLGERIALAVPWLNRWLSMLAMRQPAGSRFRQAAITRAVQLGTAANNRGDYEAMLANYHPQVEFIPPGRGPGLGFDPVYHGHEGVRRFLEQWKSGFGQHTYEVLEIADAGGGRLALRLRLSGTIGDTETAVQVEYASVNTLEGGLLIRQEHFFSWHAALAALTETTRAALQPEPAL